MSVLGTLLATGSFGVSSGIFPDPTENRTGIDVTVKDNDPETEGLTRFRETLAYLSNNYYRELSAAELLNAMAEGMPNQMDSIHSYSMTAEEYAQMLESQSGDYSGIGATIQEKRNGSGMEIIEIIENSPAAATDLKVGDIFVAIDGEELTSKDNISDVASRVRGPGGTEVEITIYRPSANQEYLRIVRGTVQVVNLRHRMLTDDLGYMSIHSFTNNLFPEFKDGIDQLVAAGAKNIIFDMRNNPGGSARTVEDMLDYLLPETDLVTEKGRQNGREYEEIWRSGASMGVPADMKYAILVNENSASASELFSGTLRDLGKAYLIGETTYGKGSGTVTYVLSDGSAVNVTIFRYYLPSGFCLEDVGLEPDQVSKLSDEALLHNLRTLLVKDDAQLQAAIRYFHADPRAVTEKSARGSAGSPSPQGMVRHSGGTLPVEEPLDCRRKSIEETDSTESDPSEDETSPETRPFTAEPLVIAERI